MRDSETILYNLSSNAKKKEYEFHRIYRLLYNSDFYYKAIQKRYKDKKSQIQEIDSETIIEHVIAELREERYQPESVKQIYISKKSGEKCLLGTPTIKDRIVQEVCSTIIYAIYEPNFSEHSHAFRENKSCHTALSDISVNFKNVNWFIEGKIENFFDNIDHHILIDIVRKKIKDEKFIRLIWKFLSAGYLEDWIYNKTYSGTPQGGIISPVLANIYLNELDQYIEQVIKPEREEIRKQSKENKNIMRKLLYSKSYFHKFKSIKYVRYADNFIFGVIGSKQDCVEIKENIENFVQNRLKLKLSKEKTRIIHSTDKANFLNYNITINNTLSTEKDINRGNQRMLNNSIQLFIPQATIERIILSNKMVKDIDARKWDILHRPYLTGRTELDILTAYDVELRGLYNYYKMARNVSVKMWQLRYVMEYSCLKTLANKYKIHIGKLKEKYRIGKRWGIRYETKEREEQLILVSEFKYEGNPEYNKDVDIKLK